jgi:WD40 repeat protein
VWDMAVDLSSSSLATSTSAPDTSNSSNNDASDDEDDDHADPRIAVACDDGAVRLFTAAEGSPLMLSKTLAKVKGARMLSVAWHPDGRRLFAGSSDGYVEAVCSLMTSCVSVL